MADRLPPELTRLADEDLLTLVERGDADAFEVIYERHSRVAFSLAFRLLGDRPSAEDLVQDAFLAVWRGAASYSSARGSVRNWLLSILHNRGRRPPAHARRDVAAPGGARAGGAAPSRRARRRRPGHRPGAGRAASARSSARLPGEQFEVLKLAYYGGFTHQEIAEMLELPLGTVKSRMRLGLERLRRGLGEAGVATA